MSLEMREKGELARTVSHDGSNGSPPAKMGPIQAAPRLVTGSRVGRSSPSLRLTREYECAWRQRAEETLRVEGGDVGFCAAEALAKSVRKKGGLHVEIACHEWPHGTRYEVRYRLAEVRVLE